MPASRMACEATSAACHGSTLNTLFVLSLTLGFAALYYASFNAGVHTDALFFAAAGNSPTHSSKYYCTDDDIVC